ncbi:MULTISPECIES: hypothetical protein [unclassified Dehalobacter]|nr:MULTISPECIES: hypothetical protein [unclassified Dehalobacter]AFV03304.1 hypothetical protein DHBDCA_p2277 [Dehalobacter sp. DCA]AFV06292.1 hypothetical protein DCF50_p2289 [Dehalobacter sp. CF]
MRIFLREKADEVLKDQIDPKTLALQYPEYKETVLKEFSVLNKESNVEEIAAIINTYKAKARFAMNRIHKSGNNQKTLNAFLPDIIKARIAIDILQQSYFIAQSGKTSGKIRFNLWDGLILQKVLFKKSFERKPVSLFWFKLFWTFITDKKILMPLVNNKGIYCFYSRTLIKELSNLVGKTKCLEIGAGDGTLTTFLREMGVHCDATDDYSWGKYIQYPDFVEKLEAKEALGKYKPETVICSWSPPGNAFEKSIFTMDFIKLYIVIGSRNPLFTGDHEAYQKQDAFTMEYNQRLSALVLPQSEDNAVYIFRRKTD